jgi:hypothetical protein
MGARRRARLPAQQQAVADHGQAAERHERAGRQRAEREPGRRQRGAARAATCLDMADVWYVTRVSQACEQSIQSAARCMSATLWRRRSSPSLTRAPR